MTVEDCRSDGFRAGFQGQRVVMPLVIGYDEQAAYLDGYREGREHRQIVDQACKEEGCTMEQLFRRAVDYYVARGKT